jgi:hypothetical protein
MARIELSDDEKRYVADKEAGFPCSVCGKAWTGHSRCHCGACHQNFSSVSAFDKHRRDFHCRPPGECGLVLVDGYWQRPGQRPPPSAHDEFQAFKGPNPIPALEAS